MSALSGIFGRNQDSQVKAFEKNEKKSADKKIETLVDSWMDQGLTVVQDPKKKNDLNNTAFEIFDKKSKETKIYYYKKDVVLENTKITYETPESGRISVDAETIISGLGDDVKFAFDAALKQTVKRFKAKELEFQSKGIMKIEDTNNLETSKILRAATLNWLMGLDQKYLTDRKYWS